MTSNLKKFRMQTFKDVDTGSDGEDPEDNTAASIKKRHKREIERAERENRENTSALLELRDMEDELKTLYRLFDTQDTLIKRMAEIYSGDALREITLHGQGYLREALRRLVEYKTQTTEMLQRVGATRGDVGGLLSPIPLFLSFLSSSFCLSALTHHSTRNCSKWPNAKPKSTTCAGPVSKPSSPAAKTCPS